MTLGKAGLVAAATAFSIWCATSDASALGYDDIIGNWCSATARLEFSHETMGVFLFSDKSHLSRKISKYEFDGSTVTVRWYLDNPQWWQRIRSGVYRGERLGTVA